MLRVRHFLGRVDDRLRERAVIARRDQVRVHVAHALQRAGVRRRVEIVHVMGAQQREGLQLGEVVTELLEPDRRVALAALPQHVHHLAVRADIAVRQAQFGDHAADERVESEPVRHAAGRELRERVIGIEDHELAAPDRPRRRQPACLELAL
jgi:hypothetical protein